MFAIVSKKCYNIYIVKNNLFFMILSKEFFSIIKRSLQEASWKRNEFAMVEAVEKELNLLFDRQQRELHPMMNVSLEPDPKTVPIEPVSPIKYSPAPAPIVRDTATSVPPLSPVSTSSAQIPAKKIKKSPRKKKNNSGSDVPKANGNPSGMSASPEGLAQIDMMIAAGLEQAKTAPIIEKRLLSHVVVEQMPETPEEYERTSVL